MKNPFRRLVRSIRNYFGSRMECICHHGHYWRDDEYTSRLRNNTPEKAYDHCRYALHYLRTHEYWPEVYDRRDYIRFVAFNLFSAFLVTCAIVFVLFLTNPLHFESENEWMFYILPGIIAAGCIFGIYILHRKYVNYQIEVCDETVCVYNEAFPDLIGIINRHRAAGIYEPPHYLRSDTYNYVYWGAMHADEDPTTEDDTPVVEEDTTEIEPEIEITPDAPTGLYIELT